MKRALSSVTLGVALMLSGCPQKNADAPTSAQSTAPPTVAGSPVADVPVSPPAATLDNALVPLPNKDGRFPVLTKKSTISMVTNEGVITLEVYPEAAPNSVGRFLELVESGFYNGVPLSRVVRTPAPFVAQFGINWRKPHNAWEKKTFKEDPSLFALERGTLCFAKQDKDDSTTQVFINLRENNALAEPPLNFTVFGKVSKGMDVVDRFAVVGEPDRGLDQYRLWRSGESYLETLSIKPTMIEKMTLVKPK